MLVFVFSWFYLTTFQPFGFHRKHEGKLLTTRWMSYLGFQTDWYCLFALSSLHFDTHKVLTEELFLSHEAEAKKMDAIGMKMIIHHHKSARVPWGKTADIPMWALELAAVNFAAEDVDLYACNLLSLYSPPAVSQMWETYWMTWSLWALWVSFLLAIATAVIFPEPPPPLPRERTEHQKLIDFDNQTKSIKINEN